MIEAFAPNGSDHSLHIGSLPRRARCRQDFADAHVSHLFSEVIAKDGIAVAQQVARELGKGKCLPQRSEEHTSELQSRGHLVCRLLLEKKKKHPSNDATSSRMSDAGIVSQTDLTK